MQCAKMAKSCVRFDQFCENGNDDYFSVSDDFDDDDDLSKSPPICEKGASTWRQLCL